MTIEELKNIKFYFLCSMSFENERTITYESEDGRLGFCDHFPRKHGYTTTEFGKPYRHWHVDGKVYKTEEGFKMALADFNPKVVPINRRPYQNVLARIEHERDAKQDAMIVELSQKF